MNVHYALSPSNNFDISHLLTITLTCFCPIRNYFNIFVCLCVLFFPKFRPYPPSSVQGLFPVMHSGITPVSLKKPFGIQGIKPGLTLCKASALPAIFISLPPSILILETYLFSNISITFQWHKISW